MARRPLQLRTLEILQFWSQVVVSHLRGPEKLSLLRAGVADFLPFDEARAIWLMPQLAAVRIRKRCIGVQDCFRMDDTKPQSKEKTLIRVIVPETSTPLEDVREQLLSTLVGRLRGYRVWGKQGSRDRGLGSRSHNSWPISRDNENISFVQVSGMPGGFRWQKHVLITLPVSKDYSRCVSAIATP